MSKPIASASFRLDNYRIVRSEVNLKFSEADLQLVKPEHLSIELGAEGSKHLPDKQLLILRMNCGVSSEQKEVDIQVDVIAHFKYEQPKEQEELCTYITQNAPAIIFPYVRAYISTLTGLSGIPPIILPTLNLVDFGKELRRALKTN